MASSVIFQELADSRNFAGAGIACLVGMPLTQLDLSALMLPEDSMGALADMPLTSLNLSGSYWLQATAMVHLSGLQLTCLRLSHCARLPGAALSRLQVKPKCDCTLLM